MTRYLQKSRILRVAMFVVVALVGGLLWGGFPKLAAQTPSILNPPYNVDAGVQITNTLRTAGTVTTNQLTNLNYKGVVCTYVQTALSGTPSVTFAIEGYDAATASYKAYATSGAITDTTVTPVVVYPGAVATSVPTGMVIAGLHLPRVWRISQTIAGTGGPAVTSKIGCNYLN